MAALKVNWGKGGQAVARTAVSAYYLGTSQGRLPSRTCAQSRAAGLAFFWMNSIL